MFSIAGLVAPAVARAQLQLGVPPPPVPTAVAAPDPPPVSAPPPRSERETEASASDPAVDASVTEDGTPVIPLNEVEVRGRRDAFQEHDAKLKKLIDKLPCTGCNTKSKKIEEKHTYTERIAKFGLRQVTPTPMPDDAEARDKDPDAVRSADTEDTRHPGILATPNNNP